MSGQKNYTPGRARRRCAHCAATEMTCQTLGRDTGRPCCPDCHHDTEEDD